MPKMPGKECSFQAHTKPKVMCKEVMSIHSTLQHICFVYRQGCSSLPPFSAFIAKFPNEYALHHVLRTIINSLSWWEIILQNPSNSHSLMPCIIINPKVLVDALTDWGISMVFGQLWAAWKLKPGWKSDGRNIGWAESITLKLAIVWLICNGYADCDITIHGDNKGVIRAFYKGHTQNIP